MIVVGSGREEHLNGFDGKSLQGTIEVTSWLPRFAHRSDGWRQISFRQEASITTLRSELLLFVSEDGGV
jgi:hypothetical protein